MLGLTLRYGSALTAWQSQTYTTLLLFNILIYLFLYLIKRLRQERVDLRSCDAFDVLFRVLKERFVQYVVLILLLTLSHNFQLISRLALVYMVAIDVAITCVLRLCLRRSVRRHSAVVRAKDHYVVMTTRHEARVAFLRLKEILPEDADLAGVLYVDPQKGPELLRKVLEASLGPEKTEADADEGRREETPFYEIHCTVDYMAGVRQEAEAQGELRILTRLPEAAHVFVYLSREQDHAAVEEIMRFYHGHGIPVSARLFLQERELPRSMVVDRGSCVTADFPPLTGEGEVLGVRFAVSNVDKAAFEVLDAVTQGAGSAEDAAVDCMEQRASASGAEDADQRTGQGAPGTGDSAAQADVPGGEKPQGSAGALSGEYICFSNVHTTVMAHDDPAYRAVLNGSAHTFADGTPIARQLRVRGFQTSERVAGPDFMDAVFRTTMDGSVSHYFYGSTQETIDKLCEELPKRYPGIRIAGAVSPPFRPETEEEDAASVAAMNESGAAFIWIGLGAPKQEKWMAAHRGRVSGVMLGVGAGFNFYAGTVKRAPKWIQKIGMEWFYRLIQDPKRLANRYIITNLKFLWYMLRRV